MHTPIDACSKAFAASLLLVAAALLPRPAFACATCGCTLSADGAMGYSASAGWNVNLLYTYINQDQLRGGTGTVSPAQVVNNPTTGELEHETINRLFTMSLGYSPNAEWRLNLQIPYLVRTHSSYTDTTSAPFDASQLDSANLSASRSSSLGDVRFIVGYQGWLPTHNLGAQLGVKLPTGDYGGPDASGTGVVGRNPVTFASGPSAGELLDTSLQPGTGSTDLIVGGYYYQAISQDFDAFINGQFQGAVAQKLDQPGADFRPGNLAVVSAGLRYEADPKIVPQLQINLSRKSHDQGALADSQDSAGTVAYLSPGVTLRAADRMYVYGFVQIPVYSNLDGYQLFPHWTATVGLNYGL
ncbi:MAG: transporter [Burkholderiales bacterium]